MIAAHQPVQRPARARLLAVSPDGDIRHAPRSRWDELLRPGDVVVANDAATLPASLQGLHVRTGAEIEVRLAARASLRADDVRDFSAVVFGRGDYRTRTEDRPGPPLLVPGDELLFGSGLDVARALSATVEARLGHDRLIALRFAGSVEAIWAGLAQHGRPIQYSHLQVPLALWDVWTPIAGVAAAFEPPSASFAIDWALLARLRQRGIEFATITLAAGISSTGDPELDRRLPLNEAYAIPSSTAAAIARGRSHGGRIIAVGTTVVRALEHAAALHGAVCAGAGVADQKVSGVWRLRVVDAILSGTHEAGTSHYDLLRAFVDEATLQAITAALDDSRYRTHEYGDSIFIERRVQEAARAAA
jgi:S-adenosylmethionine:tRNA ribosyltransferase-isomerase